MDNVGFSQIIGAYESANGAYELLCNLWALGIDVYGPMFLGSAIIGAPIAFLMYLISLRIVTRHRAKHENDKAQDAEDADSKHKEEIESGKPEPETDSGR